MRAFKEALKRGVGRCVLQLGTDEGRRKFRPLVLWACSRNLEYDAQVAGTRAWYLHQGFRRASSFDRHLAYYLARDVFDLKTVRKSKDLLRYLYEVTFCSECRRYNLQAMAARRMLTDDLLRECLYDCNEDTRRYAARLLKRRKARRV